MVWRFRGPGGSESGVGTILRLKGQKKQEGSKITRRRKLGETEGIWRRAHRAKQGPLGAGGGAVLTRQGEHDPRWCRAYCVATAPPQGGDGLRAVGDRSKAT